jgi:hypothetical protein
MEGAGNIFKKVGTWIWEGLIAGLDAIGSVFSKLFAFDGGGKGAVEKFIGLDFPWVAFAEGGLVPGRSTVPGNSLKNDTVPALLSPGEVVLPRSVLGDEAFRRIVMAKLAGQEIPQFGFGGFISSVVSGAGDLLSSGASAVGNVVSGAADFLIPDWIQELYDSISRFISGVDITKLVTDPMAAINGAIQNALSVFVPYFQQMIQPQGFATGGLVGNPTDTVPAMLTPGEFVLNRAAAQQIGEANLSLLNRGIIPSQQTGSGGMSQHNEINLTINTTNSVDPAMVKSRVMPVILEELRRASLDGRRVLAPNGVR